ncbi:MAG: hypothetical protein JF886_06540 [Candidatus Dormibacteraeota bacterium]|uniref:Uncharacterized protein n=1 Tax=Candidatus Aeolococcus gillhamiae TaxID=3127015 RepID=A0A2W5Z1Y6_9BACT|nr:hypothetical protein [Candidatus Dormibacteraeota bacterium]PZR79180.1 MAG: hypothetical protein DLM65_11335 [Candidatus Dormibacter sp. RRmetagenome_bin12]
MFRRRSSPKVEEAAPPPAGRERCAAGGCRRLDGTQCSYVDKRSRRCPTAWCPNHVADVAGFPYCRRHASTMSAIEGGEVVAGLPDLDNRAPSLVGWISRELDEPIRDVLTRVAPPSGARLVTDPVRLIITPGGSTRRWAKTWKIVDSTSVLNRVSIEVDEVDDCHVSARVDTELIGRGLPPWIGNRQAGRQVDPQVDAAERAEFAAAMARSIELVVTGEEVAFGH